MKSNRHTWPELRNGRGRPAPIFNALVLCACLLSARSAVFTVINADNDGPGSLRAAILDANRTPGPDIIEFHLPSVPAQIWPNPALPIISEQVTIDGRTQREYDGRPLITIASAGFGGLPWGDFVGLEFENASGSIVAGLALVGYFDAGIRFYRSDDVQVLGCWVGFDAATGRTGLFAQTGIMLGASNGARIGGPDPKDLNVISGNQSAGIEIASGDSNVVTHCFIGPDPSGSAPLPGISWASPSGIGIRIWSGDDNIIGGLEPADSNLISGLPWTGIVLLNGHRNQIIGNFIGVQADHKTPLANGGHGIAVWPRADNTQILKNTIANNNLDGVMVLGVYDEEGLAGGIQSEHNRISQNTIYANGLLGIDLDGSADYGSDRSSDFFGDGLTSNDARDPDRGPNGLQNFPELLSGNTDGVRLTNVRGLLYTEPGRSYTLEFFWDYECDPSGYGEGRNFLGRHPVETDEFGFATFDLNFSVGVPETAFVTATATDASGNTSEFSACLPLNVPPHIGGTGSVGGFDLVIRFSQPPERVSAVMTSNYSVTSGGTHFEVKQAKLLEDGHSVALTLDPPLPQAEPGKPPIQFTVSVSGIKNSVGRVGEGTASGTVLALVPAVIEPLGAPPSIHSFGPAELEMSIAALEQTNDPTVDQQVAFAHRQMDGDFDLQTTLELGGASFDWSEGGIMIRETLGGDSRELALLVDGSQSSITLAIRKNLASPARTIATLHAARNQRYGLRLQRVGNTFTAFARVGSEEWKELAKVNTDLWSKPLDSKVLAGFSLQSTVEERSAKALFSDLQLSPSGTDNTLRMQEAVMIEWSGGILQGAPAVTGPYADIPGAGSPYFAPASAPYRFYRVRQ